MSKRLSLRLKIYLFALMVLVCMAMILTGYYASSVRRLAVSQAAFQKRGAEAMRRVEAFLPRKPKSAPRTPTGKVQPAPALNPRNRIEAISEDFGKWPEKTKLFFTFPLDMDQQRIKEEDLDSSGRLTRDGAARFLEMRRLHALEAEYFRRKKLTQTASQEKGMQPVSKVHSEATPAPESQDARMLQSGLDDFLSRMEDCLANRAWDEPDFKNFRIDYNSAQEYQSETQKMAMWAALRAEARGDGAKAGTLLLGSLELLRSRYFAQFPVGNDLFSQEFAQQIFMLAESPRLTTATLAEAAKILASMQFTPSQLAELRRAHAQRWLSRINDSSPGETFNSPWNYLSFRENILHFIAFHRVGPDTLVFKLNAPRLQQYFQDFAEAWAENNPAAMQAAEAGMLRLAQISNLDPNSVFGMLNTFTGRTFSNSWQSPELARLALATARFHCDHGVYPASDAELDSRYLDPPLEQTSTAWRMMRLDAAEAPGAKGARMTLPARPLFYIAGRYGRFEKKDPVRGSYLGGDLPHGARYDEAARRLREEGYTERIIWKLEVVIPRERDALEGQFDLLRRLGAPAAPAPPGKNAKKSFQPNRPRPH